MGSLSKLLWTGSLLLLVALPAGASAPARPAPAHGLKKSPIGFLTGPQPGRARDLARGYLRAQRAAFGVEDADLDELVVEREYRSSHNGVTHVHLRQRHRGLDVVNGVANANVDAQGRVFGVRSHLAARVASRAPRPTPARAAAQALEDAAQQLGIDARTAAVPKTRPDGPEQRTVFLQPDLSEDEIPVRLVYWKRADGALRLAWDLVLRPPGGEHWWNLWVDAETGALLERSDWVDHASYEVFAPPLENPDGGARSVEIDPADATASPFGWHDTDGVPGAEETVTRGNNVSAQEDQNANDSAGYRPSGGAGLEFEFPLDLALDPPGFLDASITNLFYWNNLLHDLHYRYGFDEAAGNFQQNNYGRGGVGNDRVLADALDGEDLDNANFATPPEGSSPRMQMFLFVPPSLNQVVVHAPAAIAGRYDASGAAFGPDFELAGVSAELRLADDGVDDTTDACSPFPAGFFAGAIALVDRGGCVFVEKVEHAQNAGALAVVVVNNQGDALVTMSGTNPAIVIASAFIGESDGDLLKAELPGVQVTVSAVALRDSDFDAGIIAHEYGHGVSNRLTGGNVNCLNHAEEMGEGWSDFHALALTALPSHTPTTPRPIGAWLSYQPPDGAGFRNFPYTTDLALNPQTYADIATTNAPHGVGEIWASMLWEMYWNLVDAYGFDPDLRDGSGGNNLALQLVMDGMKLQPCSPTFVDARDAILEADLVNEGGANQCPIWRAFAKRGLGVSASAGSPESRIDGSEAFDLPLECQPACMNGDDDDGDGGVDFPQDPGCGSAEDTSERAASLPCDDGSDNDGDGRSDFDPATRADAPSFTAGAGDLGCENPAWPREDPQCQDGVNNDPGQDPDPGNVDFDGGASVHGSAVGPPDPQCVSPPRPWRGSERAGCGLGFELALAIALLGRRTSRARRRGAGRPSARLQSAGIQSA